MGGRAVDGNKMKEQKKVSKVSENGVTCVLVGHFRSSDLTVNIHMSTKTRVTGNNLVLHGNNLTCRKNMEGHSIETINIMKL